MEKNKYNGMKIIQFILGIMMIGSFVFFVLGEIFSPVENNLKEKEFHVFEAEWEQRMPDGTMQPVTVPGRCTAEYGEWVTIQTVLSNQLNDTWICARSMQQDMKIYVGDELRKEYSTLNTQPFGTTSTLTYLFFPLYESDAGQTLSLEFMTESSYAGYVSEMYEGGLYDIVSHFCYLYIPSAVVALLMLFIGIAVVGVCMFVRLFYKVEIDLLYLGNIMVIAATWLLVESKIRQFIFPNSTIAMLMGFLMVAVLPYPFLSYINSVQNYRYQKLYMTIEVCTAVNFTGVVLLQVLNIRDFFETMTSSHIIIIALIIAMAVTIILDIIRGYVKEYKEVAVGFAFLMLAGIGEIGLVYVVSAQANGIALCVGLVLLLVASGLKSIRDMINIEKEKQSAIAASESKAKFLANMSHEIRTPMNTVLGMNEMILMENKDEKIEEYAHNIKNAGQLLLGLINDILDFSKIEAGKLQIVEKEYRLAEVLKDFVLSSQIRAKQKGLEIRAEIDENMPSVLKGDDIRIKQILNNLMSNAIKYTEKGSVTFKAEEVRTEAGFSLLLSIKDTGMGIKQEDMEKLFSSFQRLELEKNRYIEGTGLGLTITKQLVSCMNGTIDVQSEYGKGSCFTVQIPQEIIDNTSMRDLDQKNKKSQENTKAQTDTLYIPDAKILAVDDNSMNLTLIKALLKRTGAQLDTASGGNECFLKTKEYEYDLILMDHMMPHPDGIETLHMIREDRKNKNLKTPVIALTANAIVGMREQYLAEGFEDYLSKPVEVKRLDELLKRYLS